MRLTLIRHGQTPSNVLGLLDTALPGAELTELGRTQAQELVGTLDGTPIARLHASAARRAQQTAEPLAEARRLPVRVHDDLREVAAGDWEMAGDEPTVQAYLGTIGRWMSGDLDLATPGPLGEDGHAVLARFDRAIDAVVQDAAGDPAVVVAHGAVIRFWAAVRGTGLPAGYPAHHGLRNTDIVVLDGDPDTGWTVLSWAGHRIDEVESPAVAAEPADSPADEDIPARP